MVRRGGVVHLLDLVFFPGCVIPTDNSKFDPNRLFPWMTWERFAKGRTLVGVDEDDEDFASAGLEFGEKAHLLTKAELPEKMEITEKNNPDWGFATQSGIGGTQSVGYHHLQKLSYSTTNNITTASGVLALNGGNQPHNNIQPSITVYYWRRVS